MSTKPEHAPITLAGYKDLLNEIGDLKKRVNQLEYTVDDWRGNFYALLGGATGLVIMVLISLFT
jgi:hypothetical protein